MSEDRIIYCVDSRYCYRILAYRVLKETPKLWIVKGISRGAYDTRLRKAGPSIYHTLENARQAMRGRLNRSIAAYRQQIAEMESVLATVDQMEPERG